jgi:hypothetical protein
MKKDGVLGARVRVSLVAGVTMHACRVPKHVGADSRSRQGAHTQESVGQGVRQQQGTTAKRQGSAGE